MKEQMKKLGHWSGKGFIEKQSYVCDTCGYDAWDKQWMINHEKEHAYQKKIDAKKKTCKHKKLTARFSHGNEFGIVQYYSYCLTCHTVLEHVMVPIKIYDEIYDDLHLRAFNAAKIHPEAECMSNADYKKKLEKEQADRDKKYKKEHEARAKKAKKNIRKTK